MAVKKYLKTALNVPDNRITILLDQHASRNAIIGAFKNLKDNKEIQSGDPILIFYAGHGAEIVDGDAKETRKIQAIIPQDHDGITVHPIPDRTVGGLLAEIHKVKGDNIVSRFSLSYSFLLKWGPDSHTRLLSLGWHVPRQQQWAVLGSGGRN